MDGVSAPVVEAFVVGDMVWCARGPSQTHRALVLVDDGPRPQQWHAKKEK